MKTNLFERIANTCMIIQATTENKEHSDGYDPLEALYQLDVLMILFKELDYNIDDIRMDITHELRVHEEEYNKALTDDFLSKQN